MEDPQALVPLGLNVDSKCPRQKGHREGIYQASPGHQKSRPPCTYSPLGRHWVLSLPSIWVAASPGVSYRYSMSGVEPFPVVPLLACRTHDGIWMDAEEGAK